MSHESATVGVIIPVYNRARLVIDALDSVARQTLQPGKILVVDDGSEDDTAKSVAMWIAANPELDAELMSLPHTGVSNARFKGIERLSGLPFLALLDSDDSWPNDFLERTVKELNNDASTVAVSTDQLYEQVEGEPRLRSLIELPADPALWIIKRGAGIISCTVFRTEALMAINAFDLGIPSGEDVYVFMRLSSLGAWKYIHGKPVFFRAGGSSIGEEGQLSRKYQDRQWIWAEIYDEYVSTFPSPDRTLQKFRLEALAHRWGRAGRYYRKHDEPGKALHCYKRSIEVCPTLRLRLKNRLKAWKISRKLTHQDNNELRK